MTRPVVAFYNQRGMAEQRINEGKNALKLDAAVMLLVRRQRRAASAHAPAYNLAKFMRTLALPEAVKQWSLMA